MTFTLNEEQQLLKDSARDFFREQAPVSRATPKKEEPETASFTEITLDVRPDAPRTVAGGLPWPAVKP